MEKTQTGDSLIGYLAAMAPALLQLIAVISVGLVDVLKLDKFVLAADFINIANFIVILISISFISLSSFWDYNRFALSKTGENPFSQTKNFWNILKIFLIISIIGFLIFIAIIILKSKITVYIEIWTFIQWAAYIGSMVTTSFIIYAFALLKIQEKRNKQVIENYIPRLLDSLRRYGHVRNPDIKIEYIDRNNLVAVVKLGGAAKYQIKTDFTGEMTSIQGMKKQTDKS